MTEPRKSEEPVQIYRFSSGARSLPVVPASDCVTALRALGEDTRARIVALLMDAPMDVNDVSRRLGVSPYNVSKHLRVLREAGLLQVEKSGRQRRYALPPAIRRRAEAGHVLDLGCCRFQFESGGVKPESRVERAPRKKPGSARGGRS
jgi:DNA-binding transcriptional ArsR family regulator